MTGYDDRVERLSPERQGLLRRWLSADDADGLRAAEVAPATPTEAQLAVIWREVLELDAIGLDDDYFALGGDSILAIVVVARARQAGLLMTTHDLFELRTIRRLAAVVQDPATTGEVPGRHGDRPGPQDGRAHPLTPMQEGMLFHALEDPSGTAYVVQATCRLEGDLDLDDLIRASRALVDRHPALRSSFRWHDGRPRQLLHPTAPLDIDVVDWRQLPASAQQSELSDHLTADRRRGFDLGQPPLLRLALLRLSDTSCVFALTHHHLLLDGWSQQILLRELLDFYDRPNSVRGEAPWFGRHLDAMPAERTAVVELFWRHHLATYTPTPIPTRTLASPDRPSRYAEIGSALPAATSTALASFARRHGLTLGTVLYGAWALTMHRVTGQDVVAFGVTLAGRPTDLDGVTEAVGMFINTLPLCTAVPLDQGLVAWLSELQLLRVQLDAVQDTPLTLVGRCLTAPSAGPVFDTIAVIENFPQLVRTGAASRRLTVSDLDAHVAEGYPLVFEARPGQELVLRVRHDVDLVGAEQADALLASIVDHLWWLGNARDGDYDRTVGEAVERLADVSRRALVNAAALRRDHESGELLAARRQYLTGADGEASL
jgi:hypothetical protein